jgi:hypothetical protein
MKTNPFPWLPWWPKLEKGHQLPVVIISIVLAAVLVYLAF